jgi:hypothetical protein
MPDPVRSAKCDPVVARLFEHETDQNLKQLILSVTCREEVIDRLLAHITTLRHDLLGEGLPKPVKPLS